MELSKLSSSQSRRTTIPKELFNTQRYKITSGVASTLQVNLAGSPLPIPYVTAAGDTQTGATVKQEGTEKKHKFVDN